MDKKEKKNKLIALLLIIVVLVGMNFIPVGADLTVAGRNTIGIIIVMLVCLVSNIVPLGVAAICIMMLLFLTGAASSFNVAISGFATGPVLFMFCAGAMSNAISSSPFSKRIVHKMLILTKGKVKMILLAIMYVTAIFSAFVSNVPTCAMFVTISISILSLYDNDEMRKRSGKAFMIATPVAAMIGGIMTPVGSSPNLVAIEVLKNTTGYSISFVEWCAYGTPIALVLIPLAWFLIIKVFPVDTIEKSKFDEFVVTTKVETAPDAQEKKLLVIFSGMIILWVMSSWVKSINMYVVAVVGTMLMFLPGINILDWDDFCRSNRWDAFFMVPMVISLGNVINENKIGSILVKTVFSSSLNLPPFLLLLVLCLFVMVMLVFLPNGGAAITVLSAPVIEIALAAGMNPVVLLTAMCFCATNCYLLPIESVPLIAYSRGYFKIIEMPKATWMVLVALALLISVWNPLIGALIH